MEENLSCPEGYKLACMRSSGSDERCFCCVRIVSPIDRSSVVVSGV